MLTTTAYGNVANDPELKEVNGAPVATFSLGVTTGKDQTTWVNCSVFGKRAEVIMRFYKKGAKVVVSGRGNLRPFTGRDGQNKTSFDLRVDDFGLPARPLNTVEKTRKQDVDF